jgi:hypothetical protein
VASDAAPELILLGRSGPGRGFSLNQEEIIIGHDPSADLRYVSCYLASQRAPMCAGWAVSDRGLGPAMRRKLFWTWILLAWGTQIMNVAFLFAMFGKSKISR